MIDAVAIDVADLPPRLRELVEDAGVSLAGALKLVERRGGCRIWIPHQPTDHHELTRIVGAANARKMRDYYGGGDTFEVDRAVAAVRAARDRAIVAAHGDGASAETLARDYELTARTVWRILSAAGGAGDDRTEDLFRTA